MNKYKWDYPLEWLQEKLNNSNDIEYVRGIALDLAINHDSDTLQDLFQSEMEEDGYFDEVS